jgi:twinkle protein
MKCFSCGRNYPPGYDKNKEREANLQETELENKIEKKKDFTPIVEYQAPFPERGFTKETIGRYRVQVGGQYTSPATGKVMESVAKYPLFSPEGDHVGNKVRFPDKGFAIEGDLSSAGLFGRHAFPPNSAKTITLVEGQDDALAAFQMNGGKYPVVSVHSASTAEKDVKKDFEYLNSFETIVVAFDADEPGRRAAKAVASAGFPLGKVKILTLRKFKDANDYLLAKESEAFVREWWQAPVYRPDGLKLGSDMWDEIINRKESFTTLYPFEGLNKKTFGIRLSELVVVTADTGIGKTSVLKHIEHHLLTDKEIKEKGYGVGFLHLEEPNGDTALGLLSIHNSKPYHIPTVERTPDELRQAYDDLLNNNRVVIWDHFGSNTVDAVLDKVRHMVALGCRYIVLDHLSIVVSDQSGDERKQLDEITTKLKTLTMELDIAVIAVIHTNRQGQIRGTAGVEQLANIVLRLERDKTELNEWRRNITRITVEKNRFCGYTGPASYLWYNPDTGRLSELDDDEIATFEAGGSINDAI